MSDRTKAAQRLVKVADLHTRRRRLDLKRAQVRLEEALAQLGEATRLLDDFQSRSMEAARLGLSVAQLRVHEVHRALLSEDVLRCKKELDLAVIEVESHQSLVTDARQESQRAAKVFDKVARDFRKRQEERREREADDRASHQGRRP